MLLSLLPMLSLLSLYCWLCGIVRRNQKFVNPAVFVSTNACNDYEAACALQEVRHIYYYIIVVQPYIYCLGLG